MTGSKLIFTVFIILILAIGGLLGFYFYINRTTPLVQAPIETNKPSFVGFDQTNLDFGNKLPATKTDYGEYDPNSAQNSTTSPIVPDNNQGTSTEIVEAEPQLRLISGKPIAGADFIIRNINIATTTATTTNDTSTSTKNTKTKTKIKTYTPPKKIIPFEFIRYILKENGNVFETGTSTVEVNRLTNKTIPKLQEAFFNSNGSSILIRNIIADDNIQTRNLSLKPGTTTFSVATTTSTSTASSTLNSTSTLLDTALSFLPLDIKELGLSPDKSKIFYIRYTNDRGSIANFDGSNNYLLFNSPFREWLVQWMTPSTILLNTKPSYLATGFLYTLDIKSGDIKKVLGDITGLTSLASKDGKNLIYTNTDNNRLVLNTYNFKEGSERALFPETLPEKCAWGNKYAMVIYCAVPKTVSRSNNYPDDWYMGTVHFDDVIWRLNLRTGENKQIIDPRKQVGIPLDITNMSVSQNDDYLIFKDKNTLSLWGIKLKPAEVVATVATSTKSTAKSSDKSSAKTKTNTTGTTTASSTVKDTSTITASSTSTSTKSTKK